MRNTQHLGKVRHVAVVNKLVPRPVHAQPSGYNVRDRERVAGASDPIIKIQNFKLDHYPRGPSPRSC